MSSYDLSGFNLAVTMLVESMLIESIVHWLETERGLGAGTSLALAAVFFAAAFVPVPRAVLLFSTGAAFGLSALFVIVPSTTSGSVLAFLLTRGLLKKRVEAQSSKWPKYRLVAQAVNDEGWPIIALLRFWGPVPSVAQNYLFGLTSIGLLPYSLITMIFALPQIVLFTYLGASGRSIFLEDGSTLVHRALILLPALVALAIIVLISRRIRTTVREMPLSS